MKNPNVDYSRLLPSVVPVLRRPHTRLRTLSVMLICHNECDRIEACLQSVQGWADEIVVLDSGSGDGTAEIARRYTDQVFVTDWPGFGPQRNRALSMLSGDWVLYIDADERVTPELREEIDRMLSDPAMDYTLLKMRWRTVFFGKALRYGRYTTPQSRLFKREGACFRDHQVHESLILPERRTGTLKGRLEHHSWRNYQHLQEKHLRYACLLAQQKFAQGKRGNLLLAVLRFFFDFIQQYFLRLSVLDGWRGLMISTVLAQYAFHKYAALRTLEFEAQTRQAAMHSAQSVPRSTGAGARTRVLCVIADMKEGGVQRVSTTLLGELDPARYDVTLLVIGARGEFSDCVPPQVRVIYLYPKPWLRGGLFGARLATLALGLRHDVLLAAAELRATFCVHFAARLLRKPAVLWVHISFSQFAQGLSARHARRSQAAYRDIQDVVFVSEGARRSMAEWLGAEQPGWRVIPNAFSARRYAPAPAAKGASGVVAPSSPQRATVIGIGRLETRKGFDLLIEASADAVRNGADFDLVILGEGRLRGALLEQARRAGIADRLQMPGFVHDPLAWLRRADIYVLASSLEGLPTTIIEAMACGTPVIATDCPSGPAELLDNGKAGVLLPMGDAAAMAEAIGSLLSSAELRAHYARAGRRKLREFAPEVVTAKWDRVFADVLQPAPALVHAAGLNHTTS